MKETQEGCLSRAIITNFAACKDNKIYNPGFVNKAPAHVVEAEKERAVKLTELVAKLQEQLQSM